MNSDEKELLNRMIQENDTKDNTGLIREFKHSAKLRHEVTIIQNIKRSTHSTQFTILDKEARSKGCEFMFLHYPNIYNKLLKGEIQIKVLYSFLDELEKIENGEQCQHEASYKIGTLLKKMYVDKRINMDKENGNNTSNQKKKTGMNISYEEFKKMQKN